MICQVAIQEVKTNNTSRSEAELEKIHLEIEKLRIDIPNIRRSKSVDLVVRLTPLITVTIATLGFMFSVYPVPG